MLAASLYRADGRLFASFVRPGEQIPAPTPAGEGARGAHGRFELYAPVLRDGKRVETIFVRARYDLAGRVIDYAGILTGRCGHQPGRCARALDLVTANAHGAA